MVQQPISVRKNNPGNMRGAAGTFQSFTTPQAGLEAMAKDLLLKIAGNSQAMKAKYGEGYQPTLRNLISTWAPPSENDTEGYINFVAKKTGLHPEQPLTQDAVSKLIPAMTEMEGGKTAKIHFGQGTDYAQADTGIVSDAVPVNPKPNLKLMLEAEKRGILPANKVALLAEARKRGLVAGDTVPAEQAQPKDTTSFGRTALEQGLQGATFGFSDEIMNRIGALIASQATGEDYSSLLDQATKASQERMKTQMEERPVLSIGSQLAGGLLTGGAGATTGAGTAIANSLRAGGLGMRAAKAGALGAASAGLAGFGSGSGLENRLEQGAGSTVAGGVIGAAFPVAGKYLSKLTNGQVEKIVNYVAKKKAVSGGEAVAPQLDKPLQKVYDRLAADVGEENLPQILNSYQSTKGKTLLEVGGKRIANLAEGSAQYPSGGAIASEFFDPTISAAPQKLKQSLAKNVSAKANYYDTLDDIVIKGREEASPLYKTAFSSNKQVDSPLINRILNTPEGKDALQEAAKNLQNQMTLVSQPSKELTQLSREVGNLATGVGVGKGLKLETLDQVKRAMDYTIRKAYTSGDASQAQRIKNLKNGLVSELDNLDKTGAYAKARAVSGDYLSNKDAMEAGTNFLRDDSQIIARNFKSMGSSEKRAYKVGVLKTLREKIEARDDAGALSSLITKRGTAISQKLQSILSKQEYESLVKDASAIDNIHKLKTQILGNSRTAGRQIAAEEFNDETGQFVMDVARSGMTSALMNKGIKIVARQFDGLSDKSAAEVAKILYETDPKKKYEIVKKLTNQVKLSPKSLQGTEAAQKLKAYYSLSDAINNIKYPRSGIVSVGSTVGNQPSYDNTELPEVQLPKANFTPMIQ